MTQASEVLVAPGGSDGDVGEAVAALERAAARDDVVAQLAAAERVHDALTRALSGAGER